MVTEDARHKLVLWVHVFHGHKKQELKHRILGQESMDQTIIFVETQIKGLREYGVILLRVGDIAAQKCQHLILLNLYQVSATTLVNLRNFL